MYLKTKLNFIFFVLIFNIFPMEQITKKEIEPDMIEKINNFDLRLSEQEITIFSLWTSSFEEISEKLIFFEFVNKSSTNLWISILNGNKFLMPKELIGSITNLNYSGASTIITDKYKPIFIYLWLSEPKDSLIQSKVNNPDIIYKINLLPTTKTAFLSWNKNIEPQTGGGMFGIKNLANTGLSWVGYSSEERTSYLLKKSFNINSNIKKDDIEEVKDTRKNSPHDDFKVY